MEISQYESRKQHIYDILEDFLDDKESLAILNFDILRQEANSNLREDMSDYRQIINGLTSTKNIQVLEDTLKVLKTYRSKLKLAGKSMHVKFSTYLDTDSSIIISVTWDNWITDRDNCNNYLNLIVELDQLLIDKVGESILEYSFPSRLHKSKITDITKPRGFEPDLRIASELEIYDGYNIEFFGTVIREINYSYSDIFGYICMEKYTDTKDYKESIENNLKTLSETLSSVSTSFFRAESKYNIERDYTKFSTLEIAMRLKVASEIILNNTFITRTFDRADKITQKTKLSFLSTRLKSQTTKVSESLNESFEPLLDKFSDEGDKESLNKLLSKFINETFIKEVYEDYSDSDSTELRYTLNI